MIVISVIIFLVYVLFTIKRDIRQAAVRETTQSTSRRIANSTPGRFVLARQLWQNDLSV